MSLKRTVGKAGLIAVLALSSVVAHAVQDNDTPHLTLGGGSFDGIGSVASSETTTKPLTAEMEAFLDGDGECSETRILDRLQALRNSFVRTAGLADKVTRWMEAREKELAQQNLSILEELVILRGLRESISGASHTGSGASLEAFREDLARVRTDRSRLIAQTIEEARRINTMMASVKGDPTPNALAAPDID